MWLYQSGGHETAACPIVLYEYQATRAGQHAVTFLQGFAGYLQVDGFAGYHALESDNCFLVGCMAHARRKFDEALKALRQPVARINLAWRIPHCVNSGHSTHLKNSLKT